jgi:hypothetical protein
MYKCLLVSPDEGGAGFLQRAVVPLRYHSRPDTAAEPVNMPKLDDQISTLQERLKQLKLRQQRIDARKRAMETMRERKAETRRQFVVGSVILAKVQEGAMDPMQLRDWLDQTLTRKDDRALFHLPPKDQPPQDAIENRS